MSARSRFPLAFLVAALSALATRDAAAQRLAWRKVTPAASPPATYGHAMTYDPVRQRVVLFGGVGGTACCTQANADVWEWDGSTWKKATPAAGAPPARAFGALAYAPGPKQVLAFGGLDAGNVVNDQTWLWDGTAWTEVPKPAPPAVVPPARARAAAITASDAIGVLLLPGASPSGTPESGAVFSFDTGWKQRTETAPPLVDFGAAFSPKDQRAYAFGGRPCSAPTDSCKPTSDVYQWKDGDAAWTSVPGVGVPRWGASVTFHGTGGVVALAGGATVGGGAVGDDYALAFQNPGGFTQTFSTGLSPRVHHAAAWDDARKQVVVFGGVTQSASPFAITAGAMLADTWVLDAIGTTCKTDAACSTGHCVDGVCCTEAACGTCEACNRPLYAGLCALVSKGKDEDTCATACDVAGKCVVGQRPLGLPCGVGADCLSGQCVDGVCCDKSACGVCEACGLAGSEGSCAAVAGADPDSCPNGCDFGKKKQCLKGAGEVCGAPVECASGQCVAGLCNGNAVGTDCTSAGQCKSGACVDGACCATPFCGSCQTCGGTVDDPGARGTCATVKNATDPDSCAETCDGAGVCAKQVLAEPGAPCTQADACQSGICWRDAPTDAAGVCCPDACAGACSVCTTTCQARPAGSAPRAAGACEPGAMCDGASPGCPVGCGPGQPPCPDDRRCVAGTCKPPRPPGSDCALTEECESNVCLEAGGKNICCDGTCNGPCATCVGGHCGPKEAGAAPNDGACNGASCDGETRECPDPNACPPQGCPSGQRCALGKGCIVPLPLGGACTSRDECSDTKTALCLSGRCCDPAVDPTCGLRCNDDRTAVVDVLKGTSAVCAPGTSCRAGYCVSAASLPCGGACKPGQSCGSDGVCTGTASTGRQWDLATPIGCAVATSPRASHPGFLTALLLATAGLARRRSAPRGRV